MKFNKFAVMFGMAVGAYWLGKARGAKLGAKTVMNAYADNIPDGTVTIKLIDNAVCTLSAVAKKGK